MKECDEHQARFTPYLDQELTASDRQRLEDHLAACPHCAREWRLFSLTLGHIANLRHEQPPSDLLPGIQAKLHRPAFWIRLRDLASRFDFSMSLSAATATVVVAMAAGLFFKMHLAPVGVPDQATQQVIRHTTPLIIPGSRLTTVTNDFRVPLPQVMAAHPPSAADWEVVHPDVFITVRAETPQDILLLQQALTDRHLFPHVVSPHGLMLRLHPDDLPLLGEALGNRQAVVFPQETVPPGGPRHKKLLLVAIRLQ